MFYEINHEISGNHYIKEFPNFGVDQSKVDNGTEENENVGFCKVPGASIEKSLTFQFQRRLAKRQVRGPYNSNDDSYYLELCIVVDNQVSRSYNNDIKSIQSFLIEVVNIMNLVRNRNEFPFRWLCAIL